MPAVLWTWTLLAWSVFQRGAVLLLPSSPLSVSAVSPLSFAFPLRSSITPAVAPPPSLTADVSVMR